MFELLVDVFPTFIAALIHVAVVASVVLLHRHVFCDQRVAGQRKRRDAGRVFQSTSHYFSRGDGASDHQVFEAIRSRSCP